MADLPFVYLPAHNILTMMKQFRLAALLIALGAAVPVAHVVMADGPPPSVQALHQIAAEVGARFHGRLIGARPVPPSGTECEQGYEHIVELRWLTPRRDLLMIRADLRSGRILQVLGEGLTEARK